MKKFGVIIVILIINTLFIFFVFNNSLSTSTPYDNPYFVKKLTRNLFPEGWGFFTRNPREEMLYFLKNDNDKLIKMINPCSSSEYSFGLDRNCRSKSAELEVIISQINDSLWVTEDTSILLGKKKIFSIPKDTVTNFFYYPKITGNILIVKQKRLPWAWSKNRNNLKIPLKYIEIYVKRNKK